jgi:hypothetical protein
MPQGKYSALTATTNLCGLAGSVTVKKHITIKIHGRRKTIIRKTKRRTSGKLIMPTIFIAQNGAAIHQNTPIAVTGCHAKPKKRHKTGQRGRHNKK